jgi:integrase
MPYFDKSKGKWRGRVMVAGQTSSRLFPTKSAAKEWEAIEKKRLRERTNTTYLLEAANDYLDDVLERFHKTTYLNKHRVLKGLISEVGDQPLSFITPKQILQYLNRAETRSGFNRRRKELHAFFQWIGQFHHSLKNPVIVKKLPRNRQPQRVPTDQEVTKLILVANRWERNFVVAFLTTGARKEEILRWTWANDIDFEQGRVRLTTLKTRSGDPKFRWIEMSETLRRALEDQVGTRLGLSDYVFQNRNKGFKNYGDRFTDRRHFIRKLCVRAKVEPFSYHALRRWFTSVLARHGTPLPALQRLLGHSRPSTTDRYIYSVSEDTKKAVNLLDSLEVFNGGKKEGKETMVEDNTLGGIRGSSNENTSLPSGR